MLYLFEIGVCSCGYPVYRQGSVNKLMSKYNKR